MDPRGHRQEAPAQTPLVIAYEGTARTERNVGRRSTNVSASGGTLSRCYRLQRFVMQGILRDSSSNAAVPDRHGRDGGGQRCLSGAVHDNHAGVD